jgi:Ca2+-binding RTX toxin-like protein
VDLASGTTHCLAAGPTFGTLVNETDTFYSIENVTGSNYDDHLAGDGGVNWLIGWGGNDHLEGRGGTDFLLGLDGDDLLEGGSGADQMDGGSGIDTADYSASSAGVNVTLVTGKVQRRCRWRHPL